MLNPVRNAWRVLARRPILSAIIALTIGCALAATTVAFAVVKGVLLEALPYAEPERLVAMWERSPRSDGLLGDNRNVASPPNFLAWRDELKSIDRVASIVETSLSIMAGDQPERVGAMYASAAYFEIVGAVPLVGRLYTAQEDVAGAPDVAVVSEGLWRRSFGADPSIVGKTVSLNGSPYLVMGVLPSRYDFEPTLKFASTGARDVWLPPRYGKASRSRTGRFLQVIGRLAPGASLETARREASLLAARLAEQDPEGQRGWGVIINPLRQDLVGDVRPTLLIVLGAVFLVLLIACANIANLLLTRASERRQEIAVRAALGAGRPALLRQLLLESTVLTGIGGIAGVFLAAWGIRGLVRSAPELPRLATIGLDPWVVLFSLLLTALASVLIGAVPALELSRHDLARWLTQRGLTGGRRAARMRNGLVASQVALSFTLLVGAGLLIRSLVNRLGVEIGVDTRDLLTLQVALNGPAFQKQERREQIFDALVRQTAALPGVDRASLVSIVPMSGQLQSTSFHPLDRPRPLPDELPTGDMFFVHPDYHRTMGIPLLAGRFLDERDRRGQPIVALINETAARRLWPGESAIGKRVATDWTDSVDAEVVGVVGDVRTGGPDDPLARTTFYWDYRQMGEPWQMSLIVKGRNLESLVPLIRGELRRIDPTVPLYNIETMESLKSKVMARARFTTTALGLFAALALVLATLGVYGVMAYATQQRQREIGIRIALGARRQAVLGMVMREGAFVLGPALLVGALGAFGLSRLLQTLIFEVSPADPATFIAAAALLGVAGAAACWIPARRASAIAPTEALRG